MTDNIDLDSVFRVLADRFDFSCVEEAEYLGQRRWFADLLAEADSATPALKEHADDQLKQLGNLAHSLGRALDALDAVDPALSAWLAAQSGDLEKFRDHAARLKAAAQKDSLAVHFAALPRKRWPSRGDVKWQARILALMIGRLYVLKRNKTPTFGHHQDEPGKPSTEFGRLVRDAFAAGGVEAEWSAATKWACHNGMTGLFKGNRRKNNSLGASGRFVGK